MSKNSISKRSWSKTIIDCVIGLSFLSFIVGAIYGLGYAVYCDYHRAYIRECYNNEYAHVTTWTEQYPELRHAIKMYALDGKIQIWEYHEIEEATRGLRKRKLIKNVIETANQEVDDGDRK